MKCSDSNERPQKELKTLKGHFSKEAKRVDAKFFFKPKSLCPLSVSRAESFKELIAALFFESMISLERFRSGQTKFS